MKFLFTLILAIVLPILFTVALAYSQSQYSQTETVTLEEVLQSLE